MVDTLPAVHFISAVKCGRRRLNFQNEILRDSMEALGCPGRSDFFNISLGRLDKVEVKGGGIRQVSTSCSI